MKKNIRSVTFTYVGTDKQFTDFLKSVIHDYLSVDSPHTGSRVVIVQNVKSSTSHTV